MILDDVIGFWGRLIIKSLICYGRIFPIQEKNPDNAGSGRCNDQPIAGMQCRFHSCTLLFSPGRKSFFQSKEDIGN